MSVVELAFTGICALVNAKGGMAAVMPNALAHNHIAWILVEQPGATTPTLYMLGNEEVWLKNGKTGALTGEDPGNYPEPPSSHPQSVHWIIPFSAASKTAGVVKDEYLNPDATDSAKFMSVFFHIPGGKIMTSGIHGCQWEFRSKNDSKPSLTQSVAQEVSIEAEIPDTSVVTLVSRDLATSNWSTRDFPVSPGGRIRFLIGNTLPSDIFPNGGDQDIDDHFRIYYEMLKTPVAADDQRIPHKVTSTCVTPPAVSAHSTRGMRVKTPAMLLHMFRLSGTNCPPVMMP